jgi:hypothetical protein
MPNPLLDISTFVVRPLISIDGTNYALLHPDELSTEGHQIVIEAQYWVGRLGEHRDDPEEAKRASMSFAKATQLLIPELPEDLFAKLTDTQRMAIVAVFLRAQENGVLLKSLNIGKSSRDSNASMAGALAIGSTSHTA